MPSMPSSPRPFPAWLKAVCSLFATAHLLAIGLYALAAQSGPWPVPPPFGPVDESPGPAFATAVSFNATFPYYLTPLRMTHNYHFASNRSTQISVYFEAHLKDELGKVTILKFPDEKANPWVRHRQEVLAYNLIPDRTLPPRGNQQIAAPGVEMPKVEIWFRDQWSMRIKEIDELELPRNQQVDQPSAWSKAVAQSYMRYLCREHKAVSVELIRCSRPTVIPAMLFLADRPDMKDNFLELRSHFGEYRREQ